jgi:hypothetical protein
VTVLKLINRAVGLLGVAVVPRRSVKSLIEYSNALEVNRPVGPPGAEWIRQCAQVMPLRESDRHSSTVALFLRENR